MFDDIYEIPGSKLKGEDETADLLSGTLQNFFTKGEGQPSPVLKKIRRPKVNNGMNVLCYYKILFYIPSSVCF